MLRKPINSGHWRITHTSGVGESAMHGFLFPTMAVRRFFDANGSVAL